MSGGHMLLCLSSGVTPRYREDVLRAISMPMGSHLPFRYSLGLIPESLKEPIKRNKLAGQEICIAYLDRSVQSQKPMIVPCRKAKLIKSHTLGDFCILEFELLEFWLAPDLQAFNKDIHSKIGNLPYWEEDCLKGYFCSKAESIPTSLMVSTEIESWQTLVKSLKSHADFATEPFFYYVRGVYPTKMECRIEAIDNVYDVVANSSYEIRIVQFSPGDTNQTVALKEINWLLADSDTQSLSFITNKKLAVDSDYDEKILRFRTSNTSNTVDSMISLLRHVRVNEAPKIEDAIWDFDLRFHIKPRTWTGIWQGALIGILIACQGLVLIFFNSYITEKLPPSIAVVILGLATGWVASFSLRKP
jgi:hypothetical protein